MGFNLFFGKYLLSVQEFVQMLHLPLKLIRVQVQLIYFLLTSYSHYKYKFCFLYEEESLGTSVILRDPIDWKGFTFIWKNGVLH